MSQIVVLRCLFMVPVRIADADANKHPDEALMLRLYPSLRRFAAVVAPPEVARMTLEQPGRAPDVQTVAARCR